MLAQNSQSGLAKPFQQHSVYESFSFALLVYVTCISQAQFTSVLSSLVRLSVVQYLFPVPSLGFCVTWNI